MLFRDLSSSLRLRARVYIPGESTCSLLLFILSYTAFALLRAVKSIVATKPETILAPTFFYPPFFSTVLYQLFISFHFVLFYFTPSETLLLVSNHRNTVYLFIKSPLDPFICSTLSTLLCLTPDLALNSQLSALILLV